ncbi:unnamed protein product [Ilex paraguariensis]|uniref:GDSL esterase/lipase n=1 Tax=Ilex paraguariensis TaxID=185542 RepID=A0ABC8S8C3_9AQUA
MARKTPPRLLLSIFSLLPYLLPCNCSCKVAETGGGATIRGMFVFGSSLVDSGNNNFLKNSLAKADYLPYGIDFPLGPSGRFSNGKNVIDLLGDQLQLPNYIPAFTNPSTKGSRIVHGVNYASGASGILDDTGSIAGQVISLSQQIRNFEDVTLVDLEEQLGCKSTESLPEYLFVVGTGGNDYSFNYLLSAASSNVSLETFTANLTTTLSHQLKRLYSLGGRRFVLMSVNPNGCSPMVMARQPMRKGCIQSVNRAVSLFNGYLKSLVDIIKPEMPGSNLVYVNSYKVIRDIIKNPDSKDFGDASTPCCEVASIEEGGTGVLCKKGGSTCTNRSTHIFFDGLHPTEAVNVVLATKAYASNLKAVVYPINVKQLASI